MVERDNLMLQEILDELDLHNMPIIGLAKRLEEVFIPGYSKSTKYSKSITSSYIIEKNP